MKAFLGKEVVDKNGNAVGTLDCFWGPASGRAIFFGVKLRRHSAVRVVPAWHSAADEGHALIHLGFDAYTIESAPGWDCSIELDAFLQEKVNIHFGLAGATLHLRLNRYERDASSSNPLRPEPAG